MPRRSILSTADRINLLALPDTADELIRHYTFSETDLSLIRQRRSDANRLGVAVQLCLLRFPGQGLLPDATMPVSLLQWIGRQLRIDPSCWPRYAEREETRREHVLGSKALDMMREGDTLVVWKLDRLGRSVKQLVDLVGALHKLGVQFKSLTDAIDSLRCNAINLRKFRERFVIARSAATWRSPYSSSKKRDCFTAFAKTNRCLFPLS